MPTSTENRFGASSGTAQAGARGGSGSKAGAAAAGDEKAKAKKSLFKSKKFIVILALVLAVGGGGYMFFLKPSKAAPPTGGDVVAMDATTLNLTGGHYLKIAVAIQLVKGKATGTDFSTSHAAELVIDEFSNRTVASLSTNEARKKATADLLAAVKKAYPGEVYDLFVTQFVTQ
jgi:flagellar FliL protein